MLEMSTAAQIRDSLAVGDEILQRIGRVGQLHKSKVEQAGFAVLKAPDIPSILVETAFISNPQEEALLRSAKYQDKLVDALVTGVQALLHQEPAARAPARAVVSASARRAGVCAAAPLSACGVAAGACCAWCATHRGRPADRAR